MIGQIASVSIWGADVADHISSVHAPSPRSLAPAIRKSLVELANTSRASDLTVRYVLVGGMGAQAVDLSKNDMAALAAAHSDLEFATSIPEPHRSMDTERHRGYAAFADVEPLHIDAIFYIATQPSVRERVRGAGLRLIEDDPRLGDVWAFSTSSSSGDDADPLNPIWDVMRHVSSSIEAKSVLESELAIRIEASQWGGGLTLDAQFIQHLALVNARLIIFCTHSSGERRP